jgi:hypothetical protein
MYDPIFRNMGVMRTKCESAMHLYASNISSLFSVAMKSCPGLLRHYALL